MNRKNWVNCMKHEKWIIGGLCTVLALMMVAGGFQLMRTDYLSKQLDSMQKQIQSSQSEIRDRIDCLENDQKPMVASYSAQMTRIDKHWKTVQFDITVMLRESADPRNFWVEIRGTDKSEKPTWYNPSFPETDQTASEYHGCFELPMDATAFELVAHVDDKSEVLQTCTSIADLLPVQMVNCGGSVIFNAERQMYYQTEWSAVLSDPNIVQPSFQIYKNGEMLEDSPGKSEMYDDGNGAKLTCWDGVDGHEAPCKTGDEFEMRFRCTDEFGIQYDFPAEHRVITDTDAALLWPETAAPTIAWPK